MRGEDVEFLLKSQESRINNLITSSVTSFEEHMDAHSSSYKHDVKELQNVAKERHEFFRSL